MITKGEFFKGNIKDVCAELENEMDRCKKITVGEWLALRRIERAESNQFRINIKEIRNER